MEMNQSQRRENINHLLSFHTLLSSVLEQVDNMESMLLSAKLQECYNAAGQEDLCIYCPVIGEACVARYDDKLWYRAQVIGESECFTC